MDIQMKRISLLAMVGAAALSASAQQLDRIYAQKLVDAALAKHPELTVLAMHVTPPASDDNIIIASNIGRIGKKADADDLGVLETGKPRMEMTKTGDMSVELLMRDASGKAIGVLGSTFRYRAGEDKAKVMKMAVHLRDELATQTLSLEALFDPVK
jgi:hypothetical protein